MYEGLRNTSVTRDWSDADYVAHWKSRCTVGASGCWLWRGPRYSSPGIKDQPGYVTVSFRGRPVRLHRKVLEIKLGRLLDADEKACHTCDTPSCCNPDHLEPGTQKKNIRDGQARGRQQFHPSHYTHCKHGHEFTPENTWLTKEGYRHCRECARRKGRERYRRDPKAFNARKQANLRRRRERANSVVSE